MSDQTRFNLSQNDLPKFWYNINADNPVAPAPVLHPGTLEPDLQRTVAIAAECHRNGVVVLTAGTYGNVLRFLPPLTISDALLHEGLDVLADILRTTR